jgi:hypothetical protein
LNNCETGSFLRKPQLHGVTCSYKCHLKYKQVEKAIGLQSEEVTDGERWATSCQNLSNNRIFSEQASAERAKHKVNMEEIHLLRQYPASESREDEFQLTPVILSHATHTHNLW